MSFVNILIYQIILEKFAYGELFMLVMVGYIFMFKMVKKMQNSVFEIVAGLTRPLMVQDHMVLMVQDHIVQDHGHGP